jgi:hypothetical protein
LCEGLRIEVETMLTEELSPEQIAQSLTARGFLINDVAPLGAATGEVTESDEWLGN